MNTGNTTDNDLDLDASRFGLVSRMADDLAHEIKNPLHSMLINLEVMRRKVESGASEVALERSEVVEHEIHRLHALVEQLLLLLRPPREMNSPWSAEQLLSGLITLLQARARIARVEFEYQALDESCFTRARIDDARFAVLQLFESALNAASPVGGAVRLRGSCSVEEIQFRITVERALFSPGTPLADAADAPSPLAIARALASRAGGRVELEEPQGDGAGNTVLLALPRLANLN